MPVSEAERLALSFEETFQGLDRPHDIFTRLRAEEPVAWCPEPWGGPGFWSVTRYDDVQEVSKRPDVFSSDGRYGGITLASEEMIRNRRNLNEHEARTPVELARFEGGRSMITMDPPEHTAHRRMVAPGFTPNTIESLRERIRGRAEAILAAIEPGSEGDFVTDVAAELPVQMLAELFDVPQAMRHKLFEWSNLIIGGEDPDVNVSPDETLAAMVEMGTYAMQLYGERKGRPGTDLVSLLANHEADGVPISIPDYLSTFVLMVVAGNETTRNSISGGTLALARHPEQRAKLIENPALLPRAVDEIVRWVHPVLYMRRTALADCELGGRTIRTGDKVALWYMSANRDESKWPDPFRFDVTRDGPRHLSFGHGRHLCIGWRLAEMQLGVLLEALLGRFPRIEPIGPVTRIRSNFLNSIKSLPVRYAA